MAYCTTDRVCEEIIVPGKCGGVVRENSFGRYECVALPSPSSLVSVYPLSCLHTSTPTCKWVVEGDKKLLTSMHTIT